MPCLPPPAGITLIGALSSITGLDLRSPMPFKVSIFLLVHDGKLAFPVNLQVCFDVTLITVNKRNEKM